MSTASLCPILFDPPNLLKKNIRETLLKIADDQVNSLAQQHNLKLSVDHVILCGSMTGPDWDDQSDIDLHIIYNPLATLGVKSNKDNEKMISLLVEFLNEFKFGFNNAEYEISDHPIELYFQSEDAQLNTPGIYDLREGKWIKEPDMSHVEVTDEHRKIAKSWGAKIKSIVNSWKEGAHSAEETLKTVEDRLDELKKWRQEGQASKEGLKSLPNIVFKMLRRNGMLKKLITLKEDLKRWIYDPEHVGGVKPTETVTESNTNEIVCPKCGGRKVSGCRCPSSMHDLRSLKNRHGSVCINGHHFSGALVYDPNEKQIDEALLKPADANEVKRRNEEMVKVSAQKIKDVAIKLGIEIIDIDSNTFNLKFKIDKTNSYTLDLSVIFNEMTDGLTNTITEQVTNELIKMIEDIQFAIQNVVTEYPDFKYGVDWKIIRTPGYYPKLTMFRDNYIYFDDSYRHTDLTTFFSYWDKNK